MIFQSLLIFLLKKKRKKKSAQEIVQYIKIAWVNTLGDFMYQSYGLQHLPAQELWTWKTQSNTIVKTMTFELSLWCACAKTPFPLPLVCVCFSPKNIYISIYIARTCNIHVPKLTTLKEVLTLCHWRWDLLFQCIHVAWKMTK